jgi:hypothetical protein
MVFTAFTIISGCVVLVFTIHNFDPGVTTIVRRYDEKRFKKTIHARE